MNKKAQGISLNVIIIAAIALIVLVVLVAIFTSQSAEFKKGVAGVSDTEIFRVQALSSSNCVPSKEGIATIKDQLSGLSEIQANAEYNEMTAQKVQDCASVVRSTLTSEENRENCNRAPGCVWR